MDTIQVFTAIIMIMGAYLLGSVSTAILVCKAFNKPDPRSLGSKNPGATNVLRIAGKFAAALTLIGDTLKGVIPILMGKKMGLDPVILGFLGLAAFVGHLFPVFFGFEGGKGVATALGFVSVLSLPTFIFIGGTWLTIAYFFRISSLASIISWSLAPLLAYVIEPEQFLTLATTAAILVYRHKTNLKDLVTGKEKRIGEKAEG